MAVSTEVKIMNALLARMASFVATPALPVAYPNVSFSPPAGGKFLRVQFIPNVTQRVFIGSRDPHRFIGLLQVSVCWPLNVGETAPREVAGAVAAHFPCDLRLTSEDVRVRITKRPDVSDLLVEDSRVQIPVSIEWECWT